MKRLAVVVICWNSLKRLQCLLPSLENTLAGIDAEIIVVDNGSTDGTPEFLSLSYPAVRYRRLERNHGVAYARNCGLRMISRPGESSDEGLQRVDAEYIWLLDDDTEVNPEALRTMLAHMDAHPQCGVCACRLIDAEGCCQESYKPYPGLGVKIRNTLGLHTSSPYSRYLEKEEPFHPVYVIGACQLIRGKALKKTGYLDDAIFYGPEDADFCLRVSAKGYTVDYLPSVSIYHYWRRLTTTSPFSRLGRAHIRGLIHFWRRHRRLF